MTNCENYTKAQDNRDKTLRVIISRTDNIGDVILALPMAGFIKKYYSNAWVMFMGKPYTRDIVSLSTYVDEYIDGEEIKNLPKTDALQKLKAFHADVFIHAFPDKKLARLAYKAGIRKRIGTFGRFFHVLYCNKTVFFTRRRSSLHEAQLNLKLLKPLGISGNVSLNEISEKYRIAMPIKKSEKQNELIDENRFNLILHPFSKGSAREWSPENYKRLIRLLPQEKYKIFITGTASDSQKIKTLFENVSGLYQDVSGMFSLSELIAFIGCADGLIACSTGPLHIAAALGKTAIGIYPPIRPMHPGRWAPLGKKAAVICLGKECSDCRNKTSCACIDAITPEMVFEKLEQVI